jgi:hypothetical protein
VALFRVRQLAAHWDLMPFLEAAPAACRRRVLCDKYRVTLEWCLPAIVDGFRRREPFGNEISRMGQDRLHPLVSQVFPLFDTERESTPECGALETLEDIVELSHFNY